MERVVDDGAEDLDVHGWDDLERWDGWMSMGATREKRSPSSMEEGTTRAKLLIFSTRDNECCGLVAKWSTGV